MSLFNIPVQNRTDANSISISLSGILFTLNFRFNANESKWYMDILKESVNIVSGIKLVASADLLSQFIAYDIPEGTMSVVDVNGNYADPDESNFGQSVFLRYEDNA